MSLSSASKKSFKTRLHHRRLQALLKDTGHRKPGDRRAPILVRLPPLAESRTSREAPVRIFVGTEPSQYRAERVFLWSIRKHRSPARAYEIYFMSDLEGFDRSAWKTGFTQYRYAAPFLAGFTGRAIYNDVDQIYLADPAELFDLDMKGAAVLSIDDKETSVMLLDCARLRPLWPIEQARARNRHKHFRARVHAAGLWRHMPAVWNARDDEYAEGRSKLLHFTTLHTQPWRPFPDVLRYRPHPLKGLWESLEEEADAARFSLFSEEQPSERYAQLLNLYREMHAGGRPKTGHSAEDTFSGLSLTEHVEPIARLVARHAATTILDYGSGKGTLYRSAPGEDPESRFKTMPRWNDALVTCYDPAYPPFAGPHQGPYDGVISTDVLEHIPAEDIPWVLNHLFAHARRFVYAVAACFPAKKLLPDGSNAHCTLRPAEWWVGQMQMAARGYPGVAWTLCARERSPFAFEQRRKLLKPGFRSRFFSGERA